MAERGMNQGEHRPSEVDRLSQGAETPTREMDFGGMARSSGDHPQSRLTWREEQMAQPAVMSGDGLGKMAQGMGRSRAETSRPSKPPKQSRRKPGDI